MVNPGSERYRIQPISLWTGFAGYPDKINPTFELEPADNGYYTNE
jgi:hypothetical protein